MTTEDKKASAQHRVRTEQARLPGMRQAAREAYDPFCSKRCADVDLHRWLKGSYVIPGAKAEPEPGDEDD